MLITILHLTHIVTEKLGEQFTAENQKRLHPGGIIAGAPIKTVVPSESFSCFDLETDSLSHLISSGTNTFT